ncbi:MAG: SurA N-terminal domain-containing protein [Planctomycetes bacterium]|nr:SurA N-terminal domain-containing protein [Planctomycetota bacterium]
MDLFRRKQKLVFMIVTPIIIIAFVFWGMLDFSTGASYADQEIARVDGKAIPFSEFDGFRRRIGAALGGAPLVFSGAPGMGGESEEVWKYVFTYALLQDAQRAGFRASDLQVGTYIENSPTIAGGAARGDRQALERAVNTLCNQMGISRQEFLRGVNEWLTIGNYLDADSNLSPVNDQTAFAFYALNKGECVIKRVRVNATDSIREEAAAAIRNRPPEELDQDIRDFVVAHADERRYRTPSAWRFSWILAPFVAETVIPEPTETELRSYYDAQRTQLFPDQTFDDAREAVLAAWRREEVENQTLRNFTVDFDPQLRDLAAGVDAEELIKLTPLVRHGATAGDTGPNLLSPDEILARLPEGSDPLFRSDLQSLDEAGNLSDQLRKERDAYFEEWRNGYLVAGRPLKSDKGYFRLRLLDYTPSEPAAIDDADGTIRPEIRELAIADLIQERVEQIVEERALELEGKLREMLTARHDGEAFDPEVASDFDALPTETVNYMDLDEAQYALGRLVVGDLMGPIPFADPETGAEGQELIVLVDRRVPGRAEFEAEEAGVLSGYRQVAQNNFRGNWDYQYTINGPVVVIQPSPTVMGLLADRFNRQEITINRQIFAEANEG